LQQQLASAYDKPSTASANTSSVLSFFPDLHRRNQASRKTSAAAMAINRVIAQILAAVLLLSCVLSATAARSLQQTMPSLPRLSTVGTYGFYGMYGGGMYGGYGMAPGLAPAYGGAMLPQLYAPMAAPAAEGAPVAQPLVR
jgi:hypothetical protein